MSTPPIIRLPVELRQQIYTYLLPQETVSHPLPSVGITSVSHRLPPASLLFVHPTITNEILDYYYSITTWKLIFSHAFNFFRVDPDLSHLEQSPVLARLRKVEVVFFCDILLLREYPSFGLGSFCTEIKRRADRACHVLSNATKLSSVTVSWIDTTLTGGWDEKAKILQPLQQLGKQVMFKIGEINGPDDVDRDTFLRAMRDALGSDGRLEDGMDGSRGEPSEMRMLAFDVRQERPWRTSARTLHECGGRHSPEFLQDMSPMSLA